MNAQQAFADSMISAFRRAVELAPGQVRFAQIAGRSQGAVSKRLAKRQPIWAESVIAVEAATGISRHELRPDIYPVDPPRSSPPGRVLPGDAAKSASSGNSIEGART